MIIRFIGAQWLASLFVAIVSFLISILIARALGPDDFGIYSIALSVGAIFAILIDGGFGKLLQRERAKVSASISHLLPQLPSLACGHALLATFVFSLFVLVVLPSKSHTLVAAICFFGMAVLNQFGLAILRGDGRLVRDASWQIGNRSFTAICVLTAVYLFDASKPWHIFLALLVGALIFGALVLRYLKIRPNFGISKQIYLLVLPFVWLDFASVLYFRADMILLGLFKVPKVEIGHYGVAYRLLEAVMLFAAPFCLVLFKKFRSDAYKLQGFISLLFKSTFGAFLVGIFFYLAILAIGDELIALAYGAEFLAAAEYLMTLALALVFILPNLVLLQAAIALDLEKWLAFAASIAACVNIIGNSILIPIYGPNAAAWMTIATEGMLFFLVLIVIAKKGYPARQLKSFS